MLRFFLSLLLFSALSFSCKSQTCTVNSTTLHVRESPTIESKIVQTLNKGQTLSLSGNVDNNGWIKITVNNKEGFVYKKYLNCGSAKKVENKIQVWICTSNSAYAYHFSNHCRGLNRCGASISKISESDAKNTYYRTPCKICY